MQNINTMGKISSTIITYIALQFNFYKETLILVKIKCEPNQELAALVRNGLMSLHGQLAPELSLHDL